jgi:hypothetical protein
MYGFAPSEVVRERYGRYLRSIGQDPTPQWLDRLIRDRVNLEAVEFALRLRSSHHPLRQRMHILSLICEPGSLYWDHYYNGSPRRARAWASLLWNVARSSVLWARGTWLVRRYRLV